MIGYANESDINNLVSLWEESFHEEYFAKKFFAELVNQKKTLVYREDGQVVSMLNMIPCRYVSGEGEKVSPKALSHDGNVDIRGAYLYALATRKEYRNRGIMSKLIREAVVQGEKLGCSFLYLMPADGKLYHFYEQFDFNVKAYAAERENLFFDEKIREYVFEELSTEDDNRDCPEDANEMLKRFFENNKECGLFYLYDEKLKKSNGIRIYGFIPY
ncbi:MAG: GNAT family N-acetyltransferase [Lachnospiraceae bacterium]